MKSSLLLCSLFFSFMLMISLNTIIAMEKEESEPYVFKEKINMFDLLSDEVTLGIFSYLIAACENQNETFQTFNDLQLVCNHWYGLINDTLFTQAVIKEIYTKFLSSELNLFALLHITQESRTTYKRSLQTLRTIAQYAFLHHNELCKESETEEYPWARLEMGCYCNAMRKSNNYLLTQCFQEGIEFTKLSEDIDSEYELLKQTKKPKELLSNYPKTSNPYRTTAELLYCAEHTEQLISKVFSGHSYTEKIVQFWAMIRPFDSQFDHPHVWQPIYLKIRENFFTNKELSDAYVEQSKLFYNFI